MRHIYHLIAPSVWRQQGPEPYRHASLESEGFIHCSNREQVAWAANKFYGTQSELAALVIDADRLTSPLRDEDPGIGTPFPHIYGPINRDAIVAVEPLRRTPDGKWELP
jgi:uncharacterized protein (DUF952 family)